MQKNTMKLALLLVLCLAFVFVLAGCPSDNPTPGPNPTPTPVEKTYTYNDYVNLMATNWNPHRYESEDDNYPLGFTTYGFYDVMFADDTYSSYTYVPAMAAAFPEDVTDDYREEWNLGDDQYRAWKIALNPNAKWENGEAINADTYLYSFKQLIDPTKANYRASDWTGSSDFAVEGGEEYYWSDRLEKKAVYGSDVESWETTTVYINFLKSITFFGNTAKLYYDNGYASFFVVTDADGNEYDLYEKYYQQGYVACDAELIDALLQVSENFGDTNPAAWKEWVFYDYQHGHAEWDSVGLLKTGEYEIVFILNKSLGGEFGETYEECDDNCFYLLYSLSGNFLVYPEYYENCAKYDGGTYSTTYNTSLETTMSYGPYKMTAFTRDAYMKYERNTNWWGYSDARYEGLYQTDVITTNVVKENKTVKQMFMKGEVMSWGLSTSDDFAEYRASDYSVFTPADAVFFMVLSGHQSILDRATETVNKSMILNNNFRKGMSLAFDKEKFAASVSPSRSGAYGILGTTYVVQPSTGLTYRETDYAKQALVDYYGIAYGEGELYATLDEAVDAITGYDAELAKEYFVKAYEEEVAAGRFNDNMVVEIDYSGDNSTFITTTLNYMEEAVNQVVKGTPLENKIKFVLTADAGDSWDTFIKDGTRDLCLCGWQGARMNPFGLIENYILPDKAYDAQWFDGREIKLTIEINDEEVTLTMLQWSQAIQGVKVTDENGVVRSYGSTDSDWETRTMIMAECEKVILGTGSYIPMLQNAGVSLHSAKISYITYNYNNLLGFGGIMYHTYNYSDAEWTEFIKAQGGNLEDLYRA